MCPDVKLTRGDDHLYGFVWPNSDDWTDDRIENWRMYETRIDSTCSEIVVEDIFTLGMTIDEAREATESHGLDFNETGGGTYVLLNDQKGSYIDIYADSDHIISSYIVFKGA